MKLHWQLAVKKLHLHRKAESLFAKNLLNYLNNVWVSWGTTRHGPVPKKSKYSAKGNTAEVKSQTNVSKIPIYSNLTFNNDANATNKQTSWKTHE